MRQYFQGYYFKCQHQDHALAIIPACHQTADEKSCSIQIITHDGSWSIPFPYTTFKMDKKGLPISIQENFFSPKQLQLNIHTDVLNIEGSLHFKELTPLHYDIMGPFHLVPRMECYHEVISMSHLVSGDLHINNEIYHFQDDLGYIEGDRGRSFPQSYLWTHCFFDDGSIMLSVATIPLGLIHFTGIICAIHYLGKEYRLATYLGAKVVSINQGNIHIRQGHDDLIITYMDHAGHSLLAPQQGQMARMIRENIQCHASYCFKRKNKVLFEFQSHQASFEYEYPQ